MSQAKCQLCNESLEGSLVVAKVNRYEIKKCSNCQLTVTDLTRSTQVAKTINEEIYDENYREGYLARREELVQRAAERVKEIKDIKPSGGKVLEVGSSYGFFLEALARDNKFKTIWDFWGVELSKPAAEYTKKLYPNIFNGYLEEAKFTDKSFDVVAMWDVLEHIPDLSGILKEVKRILKDDGIFVIQSPNSDSLMAKVFGNLWEWWWPPDHIWHFTPISIKNLYDKEGLEIRQLRTWESNQDFTNNLQSAFFNALRPRRIFAPIFRTILKPVAFVIRSFEGKDDGGLLVVVASKK